MNVNHGKRLDNKEIMGGGYSIPTVKSRRQAQVAAYGYGGFYTQFCQLPCR